MNIIQYGGKVFRRDERRKYYVCPHGGKLLLLHREMWKARHGEIPEGHCIRAISEWDNFDASNWVKSEPREFSGGKGKPRLSARKRPVETFNGIVYYLSNQGYFESTAEHGSKGLHRAIWEAHNGPIPEGFHIHHRNEIKTDNRIENLECILGRVHSFKHYGTEEGRKALSVRMKTYYQTPEGKEVVRLRKQKYAENRLR